MLSSEQRAIQENRFPSKGTNGDLRTYRVLYTFERSRVPLFVTPDGVLTGTHVVSTMATCVRLPRTQIYDMARRACLAMGTPSLLAVTFLFIDSSTARAAMLLKLKG